MEEQDWRQPDTTPEFREAVGRTLTAYLDSVIVEKGGRILRADDAALGGVRLFSDGPLVDAPEDLPEPVVKRPKLSGIDLQKYQLKLKQRCADKLRTSDSVADQKMAAAAGKCSAEAPSKLEVKVNKSDASSDSDDSDEMSHFAEAAVSSDFIESLKTSKTFRLDKV